MGLGAKARFSVAALVLLPSPLLLVEVEVEVAARLWSRYRC